MYFFSKWSSRRLLDFFIFFNFLFLSIDITLAHGSNQFAIWEEWIPLIFSVVATLALLPTLFSDSQKSFSYFMGILVGSVSILVGIAGVFFHLERSFFVQPTLKNLVYSAPFAAPLAYCGLGLLLFLNRWEREGASSWEGWIVLLACGGFFGNFLLALLDHAQNAFFFWTEWIPVLSGAIATIFLFIVLFYSGHRYFLRFVMFIMGLQILVGVGGFIFHGISIFQSSEQTMLAKLLHSAPLFAPLLFANIAFLAAIGLHEMLRESESKAIDIF